VPLLVYEIEHEDLYARGFVHMTLKHRPPANPRKEKTSVLAQYAAFYLDEGHKLLERTLDLLSAARPLIKNGDKLDCQN